MEYRRLKPEDMPAVAAFAIEGMRADLYPGLRLNEAKVLGVVDHFRKSCRDFHLVAFDSGRVAGAIAAVVSEMLFFERCEAHVVMCRAVVPGTGSRLIGALRAWADEQMMLRRVQFPQEFHADPRALKLLARHGFSQQVTTCVFNKE